MVSLPSRVALEAGHIADHNALHSLLDGFEDNVGSGEINFNAEYGPINTSTGDDTVLLQTAIDDLPANTWLKLSGAYGVSAPLLCPTGTRIRGPAQLFAMSTFDFSATMLDAVSASHGVAVLMLTNGGFVWSLGRLYLEDVTIEGQLRTNSRGVLASLQQPGYWNKVRINDCRDYAMKIKGQQHVFHNTEIIRCDQGVVLADASFMWFFGFNVEKVPVAAVTDLRDGTSGGVNCQFYGCHFELGSPYPDGIAFWLTNTVHTKIFGVRCSQITGQKFLYSDRFGATRPLSYSIYGAYTSTSTNTGTFIEDVDRGLTLDWWNDMRGVCEEIHAVDIPTAQAFTDPNKFMVLGNAGRKLTYGGTRDTSPTMDFTPATTQTAPQTIWRDSAGVQRFNVDKSGHANLPAYSNATRPASSGFVVGTPIWNTDDHAPNFADGANWRDAAGNPT